jgi:predicted alpha/beta-hydrolase family hydrolase
VETYPLSSAIKIVWAADGNHDLSPSRGSPFTSTDNITAAADAVLTFALNLT